MPKAKKQLKTFLRQGVVYSRVDQLVIGQRCDLEADMFADEAYWDACEEREAHPELKSEHPEFQFGYETVTEITPESDECTLIQFESGFACGFPPEHEVEVDPDQTEEEVAKYQADVSDNS